MQKINVINDCRGMYNEEIITHILTSRGIKDKKGFLHPSAEDIIDINVFKNIQKAGDIILKALKGSKKILVHADVDNDGVSSGTIMVRYLKSIGADVDWTINDMKEHGTSDKLISKVMEMNPGVVIIVDSLDMDNLDGYEAIKNNGAEIIVLDHHIVTDLDYDKYITLVSSNKDYPNPQLSGSGVCWKFCCYLDSLIGTFEADNLVDLAMSGIVSDMVDLSEESKENRAIVNLGLNNLNNPALRLINGGYEINSKFISFGVSPKVNACNRLNKNELAMNALLEDDIDKAKKYIKQMDIVKQQQNSLVEQKVPELEEQLENQKDKKVGIVISTAIEGINGLIANQLMAKYKKPIIVLKEKRNEYQGSARACGVKDFNAICSKTELCSCAGHENAFGIHIPYNCFDEFKTTLEEYLKDVEFVDELDVDVEINIEDVNDELINLIKKIDFISGQGSPSIKIKITINNYEVSNMSKGKHLVFKTPSMDFIQWNYKGNWDELEEAALFEVPIECVGTLTSSNFGRKYRKQMIMESFELRW